MDEKFVKFAKIGLFLSKLFAALAQMCYHGNNLEQRGKFMELLAALAGLGVAGVLFLLWQSSSLTETELPCPLPGLPAGFSGCRVLHISDLHNHRFGPGQARLVRRMKALAPHIIVVTGDSVDKRRTTPENWGPALAFFREAVALAPTYFVPGNHEAVLAIYPQLRRELEALGAICLEESTVELERGGSSLLLAGLPSWRALAGGKEEIAGRLAALRAGCGGRFFLLLSHHPELLALYAQAGVDLALCGHAHGGYVRLPWVGGLYAPGQGLFPRYTSGLYCQGGTTMAVSRGLGTSVVPLRVFNRPQLLLLQLEAQ